MQATLTVGELNFIERAIITALDESEQAAEDGSWVFTTGAEEELNQALEIIRAAYKGATNFES